jgi:hypothetical protein
VTRKLQSAAHRTTLHRGFSSRYMPRYLRRRCFTLLLLLLLLQRSVMTCERWQGRDCSAPAYQIA